MPDVYQVAQFGHHRTVHHAYGEAQACIRDDQVVQVRRQGYLKVLRFEQVYTAFETDSVKSIWVSFWFLYYKPIVFCRLCLWITDFLPYLKQIS